MPKLEKKDILASGSRLQAPSFIFERAACSVQRAAIGYILLFIVLTMGCATIWEGAKCTWGVSTKVLEDGRKKALVKKFNYDHATCYEKVKEALERKGFYIYAQPTDKKMIAVYLSKENTTPVGIFFEDIDAKNTQIEVSSPSTYAKEFTYKAIVSWIEGRTKAPGKEGAASAKENEQSK